MQLSERHKRVAKEKITPLFYLLSFIPMLFAPFAQALGGSNGGGGYSVQCTNGNYYAMDYVATEKDEPDVAPEIAAAKSSDEILAIIAKHLRETRPELALSLEDFAKLNASVANAQSLRLWITGKHRLEKLNDQQTTRDLRGCLGNKTEANVFQAVIRNAYPNGITYEVDTNLMDLMERTGPLQGSMTRTHEWLRDFTEDPHVLMNVNHFLHSPAFFRMNTREVELALRRFGLNNLPGSDRIRTEAVPQVSAVRLTWDGAMGYRPYGAHEISLRIYLCPNKIKRVPVNPQYDSYDDAPNFSACHLEHDTGNVAVPSSGFFSFFPTGLRDYKGNGFEIYVPGAEINSMFAKQIDAHIENGPYLTIVASENYYDGQAYEIKNYDLATMVERKALWGDSLGETLGVCEIFSMNCLAGPKDVLNMYRFGINAAGHTSPILKLKVEAQLVRLLPEAQAAGR